MVCVKFGKKFSQWFWRKRNICKMFTVEEQTGKINWWMDGKMEARQRTVRKAHLIFQLRWVKACVLPYPLRLGVMDVLSSLSWSIDKICCWLETFRVCRKMLKHLGDFPSRYWRTSCILLILKTVSSIVSWQSKSSTLNWKR